MQFNCNNNKAFWLSIVLTIVFMYSRVISYHTSNLVRLGGAKVIFDIPDRIAPAKNVRYFASFLHATKSSANNRPKTPASKSANAKERKPMIPVNLIAIDNSSTTDNVLENLKELRKTKSHKKLLHMLDLAKQYDLLDINVTKEALRTIQTMNQTGLGKEVFQLYLSSDTQSEKASMELSTQPISTGFLVKWFCRAGNMDVVELIFSKINLNLFPNNFSNSCITIARSHFRDVPETQEYYNLYFSDLLSQAAFGFACDKNFKKSLACLETMQFYNMTMDLDTSRKLLKLFTKESNTQQSREAVRLLLAVDGVYDQDSLQIAVNSFMRSIDFVKGSVSMETLPPEAYGEVAFIGRSNVGKSSLINAISNRKNLAYTSKTAGKTSEFNYFLVTGCVGVMKEDPKFYLIDLPGVGYAQRSKAKRSTWTTLMDQYTRERSTLRCIFHLIDSRHGVMDADDECFQLLENLPEHVKYVVVFTKVDKLRVSDMNKNDGNQLPVAPGIYHELRKQIERYTAREVPILFTSAETKHGALSVLQLTLEAVADLSNPQPTVVASSSPSSPHSDNHRA